MQLILFTKSLAHKSIDDLISLAHECNVDGYDFCVREGHLVTPQNVSGALADVAGKLRANGLSVPMVTAEGSLNDPEQDGAEALLQAMDRADVRLLKLGYYMFNPPQTKSYAEQIIHIRKQFTNWAKLAKNYNVRVCYHTHSQTYPDAGSFMGQTAGGLYSMLEGQDSRYVGAYLDAGHLCAEGEAFQTAVKMLEGYVAAVSVKDVLIQRRAKNNHGEKQLQWVEAGKGMVDWTLVLDTLKKMDFNGPVSIHCEFDISEEDFEQAMRREARFFTDLRSLCLAS